MLSLALVLVVLSPAVLGGLQLVLDDNFNSLNLAEWEHEVTLRGGGNWEFQAYTPDSGNTYVRDNVLFIKPTPTSDKFGERFLTQGVWDMYQSYGTCTNPDSYGCKREGKYGTLNPVMSGMLKSRKSIKYGRVEVVAKLPRGDWLWPAIWMLPRYNKYGTWPRSGEIDIMESRGNVNYGNIGVDHATSTLHWSVNSNSQYSKTTGSRRAPSATYADGFHTFVLDWDENGMRVYADNEVMLNVRTPVGGYYSLGNFNGDANIWRNGNKDAPFDNEFYLILNVAVGGTNGYFPDNVSSNGKRKPWKNTSAVGPADFWAGRFEWKPTWNGEDAAMQVKSVKMWKKV